MSRKVVLPRTESEQALLDISGEQWDLYNDMFVPLEDMWLDSIRPTSGDYAGAAGRWTAETVGQFAPQEQQARQGLFADGASTGSGLFVGSLADVAARKGRAAGEAVNSALNAEDMDYYQKAILAGQFGQGVSKESIGGLYSSGASKAMSDRLAANAKIGRDNASVQNQMGWMNLIGTGIGLGGAYAMDQYTQTGGGDLVVQKSPGAYWETEVGNPYVFHTPS